VAGTVCSGRPAELHDEEPQGASWTGRRGPAEGETGREHMVSPGVAASGSAVAAVFLDGAYEDAAFYRGVALAAGLRVAADGGAHFLLAAGITPQVVVGDFDSLPAGDAERLAAAGAELVRHPVRKDRTDGELAVDEALRRGARELVLAGALGALDHTLGHLAILWRLAARGIAARLVAPHLTVRVMVAPLQTTLGAPSGTRVSVVALGGDAILTLSGFDYPLARGRLPAQECLGLGNYVAASGAARITVYEGAVAVLVERGDEGFDAVSGEQALEPTP
jgi:thiamine pyrophosphokinase